MSFLPWRVTKDVGTVRERLDGLVTVSDVDGNVTQLYPSREWSQLAKASPCVRNVALCLLPTSKSPP